MATSVFIWPGIAPGGSFSGQMVGPAADNTASPPFTFSGDLTSGYASSAVGTLDLVTAGTSRLKANAQGVGVGATIPAATSTLAQFYVANGTMAAQTGAAGEWDIGWNIYYNSGWKRRLTDTAARISYNGESQGCMSFDLAASGSADASIVWAEELRINTSNIIAFLPLVSSGYLVGSRQAYGSVQSVNAAVTLSGATSATGNIIPAGATVINVATTTTTTITGATGYQVGDGTTATRYGDITGTAVGTHSGSADGTTDPRWWANTARAITLTAKTSNFTAGVVQVTVYYQSTTGA